MRTSSRAVLWAVLGLAFSGPATIAQETGLHDPLLDHLAGEWVLEGTIAGEQVTHDIEAAYDGAEVVYAKSWGALPFYGDPEREWELRQKYRHFMVDEEKMSLTNHARFSHCLPLRRNIKATDAVMDADYCVALDEAENRLHVQKAVMMTLMGAAP